MDERECKGIWIPIEIWEDDNLSWNEKILFLEIDSYTSHNKECFFSNQHIAELLKITETSASRVLSSLIEKGYVIRTSFDGRKRYVKTAFSYNKAGLSPETSQNIPARQVTISTDDNIYNTINNTTNNSKELKKDETKGWRDDFSVYLALVNDAKDTLANDKVFFEQMNKYHTNVDFYKTLDKMVEMYWGTEQGWENKKKKRSKTINMVSTLKNNFGKNIVYLPRGQSNVFKNSNDGVQKNNNNDKTIWQL